MALGFSSLGLSYTTQSLHHDVRMKNPGSAHHPGRLSCDSFPCPFHEAHKELVMNTLYRSLNLFEHMPIREAHLLLKSFEFTRKISGFNLRPFEPFWTLAR